MADLTPDERVVLQSFVATVDAHDWSYCRAHMAIDGDSEPLGRSDRQIVRSLCAKGLLIMVRGGQDEDGELIGGTFYGPTRAGRLALKETEPHE